MELIRIFVDKDFNIQWTLNPWVVITVLIGILVFIRIRQGILHKDYEIDEAELGIGSAKVKIKPNYEDLQIAYKLLVELSTRKIGLLIDIEHDVIVEVYDSWYKFFGVTRELIKDIPASKIRKSESTRNLVNIAIEVLNVGIRPHLTKWQAKFRRWYENESKAGSNAGLSPQQIQKKFPDYKSLVEDMQNVNKNLIKYKDALDRIVMGK
ncbi:MAG: hypothetical protein WC515_06295 [Candidatus Omnitrophota bacterium]